MAGLSAGLPGNTIPQDTASAMAMAAGMRQGQSRFADATFNALDTLPNASTSIGFTAWRGANTIMGGGFGGPTTMMRNLPYFRPRAFTRFSGADMFTNDVEGGLLESGKSVYRDMRAAMRGEGTLSARAARAGEALGQFNPNQKSYTMFQTADMMNNFFSKGVARRLMKGMDLNPRGMTNRMDLGGRLLNKIDPTLEHLNPTTGKYEFVEKGMLSRMTAMGRMGRISSLSETAAASANELIVKSGGEAVLEAGMSGATTATHFGAQTATSFLGARVVGYSQGARFGGRSVAAGLIADNPAYTRFATRGIEHLAMGVGEETAWAGGKIGAKAAFQGFGRAAAKEVAEKAAVAGVEELGTMAAKKAAVMGATKFGGALVGSLAAGPLAPVVATAMTAWMVYDLTKLGVGLARDLVIKPATQFAKDAGKSWKGQIDKPVFGMGFVDNEVSATSRARGTAAIQNSRLNARSILGSEASGLHAHFGG